MTRLVLDTNVVVAGLLWLGPPRRLIDHAIERRFELCSSPVLIDELTRALGYPKFARRMAQRETNVAILVAQYQTLAYLLMPSHIPRAVPRDADDDHVIACAVAAGADFSMTTVPRRLESKDTTRHSQERNVLNQLNDGKWCDRGLAVKHSLPMIAMLTVE